MDSTQPASLLAPLDWIVIAGYFVLVFAVAFGAAAIARTTRKTAAGYFLAGRNVGWFIIGASLFASNIGSEHLVGLAGAGASSGVALGQYEIQASLVLLLLGWLFVPFYLRSNVYTMPEFLERRYSPAARWYLALISIVGYVLTKISVTIYAGGVVFTGLLGIDFWTGALIVVVATGIYTVFGGLRAVLYTDMLQAFVLIGGAVAVTVVGLHRLGGWETMRELAGPDMMSMWKPMTDPDFPWTGVLLGAPIVGVWYWCTDQFIVQRVLSAANVDQARRGTVFAAYLKVLPLFLFVIPGVIAYCLVKQGAMELGRPDEALPTLIRHLLPGGVRGLVIAGLLAALMSSLSSVFNSCSTLVTWDIYRKIHPEASERRLVIVGQIATVAMVVAGLLWIPFMQYISGHLYQYLQSVQAYIAPPITAVFLLGLLWRRINQHGAITALIAGFCLGMGRLALELNKPALTEGGLLHQYADMNFMHFALFLFVLCAAVLVVVSLATPAPSRQQTDELTFAGVRDIEIEAAHAPARSMPVLTVMLSIGVVAAVATVWLYFRP